MIGVLVGDCLGKNFEGISNPNMSHLIHVLDKLENCKFEYTDDTALTKAVCTSLIKSKALDVANMAESLVTVFEREPWRGYASGAVFLFQSLIFIKTKNNFEEEAFIPALNLFEGTGSFGNGSGMRIGPIALYTIKKSVEEMVVASVLATCLTHTNYLGIIGALLQCYAIRTALHSDAEKFSEDPFLFSIQFFDATINFIENVEENLINMLQTSLENPTRIFVSNVDHHLNLFIKNLNKQIKSEDFSVTKNAYSNKLKNLKTLLIDCQQNGKEISNKEFHQLYAKCNVTALESIPVAIFSFLIAINPNCEHIINSRLKTENSFKKYSNFERVILYSISLGGDTDTIASMAGAIYGGFSNEKNSPFFENIIKSCESSVEMKNHAENLCQIFCSPEYVQETQV